MKKSLSVIMLLVSTIVGAGEITREEYQDLWNKNKAVYENVEVGMTAEYQSSYFIGSEGPDKEECLEHTKEIVVSTDHSDKYLIYKKVTALNDCSFQKKGELKEELRWRKLYLVDADCIPSTRSKLEYTKIKIQGAISTADAVRTFYSDNRTEKFKIQIDHSKSQFYSSIEISWGEDSERLLRRSMTDTSSLKLEDLEINDIEIQN